MFIGVDVGTGSARACLMNEKGEIVALAAKPIQRWEPKQDYFNQSAQDIWESICFCTKQVLEESGVNPDDVKGIAYDATCSLVVTNKELEPIAVGPDFSCAEQNIILWMDHRAPEETDIVAATKHSLLKYVGGKMSIEMEIPKIMWLKNNMEPEKFAECNFYDLSDYLTDFSTDVNARSYCSVVCKQGYVPKGLEDSEDGWNKQFLESVGLGDLTANGYERLGGIAGKNGKYYSAGQVVGNLSERAAKDLGLSTKTVVGSGVIDAYSGWIGTVAAKTDSELPDHNVSSRLAAVAGTSTCHIVQSDNAIFVEGVWGPYRDALMPNKWCAEGGQSATGELLHHVLSTHPASAELDQLSVTLDQSKFDILNDRLEQLRLAKNYSSILELTKNLFFYGDLHGNRSPIADPSMRGSLTGIGMDVSLDNLALLYLATVEFICQQTRQIIDVMNKSGHDIRVIYLSGGQCRNGVLVNLMATATQRPVVIPKYIDAAVVLGTAMLAASAASGEDLWDVMSRYSAPGRCVHPGTDKLENKLLEAKYQIFLDQAERQVKYRQQVAEALKSVK